MPRKSFFYNLLKVSLSTVVVVFILASVGAFATGRLGLKLDLPFIARVDLSGYVTRSELFEKLAEYLKKGEYFISSLAEDAEKLGGKEPSYYLEVENLEGKITEDQLDLNLAAFQKRVSSTCASGSSIRVINADGTVVCEADTVGGTGTTYTAGSGLFLSGTEFSVSGLTNAHIASGAAIAWSKISKTGSSLADLITKSAADLTSGTLADARLSANVALLGQTIEGTEITDGTVANVDISDTAAIAYSKLALTSSIVNSDISGTAAIAYSKLNLGGSVVNADISGTAAVDWSKISKTGSSLADLLTRSAGDLTSGTLADARLSSNVALLDTVQTFTTNKTFGATSILYLAGGTTYYLDNAGAAYLNSLTAVGSIAFPANSITDAMVVNTITASSYLLLTGGTLTGTLTVSGVSGLTDADIPDNITASNYLLLTGGTLSGSLTVTGGITNTPIGEYHGSNHPGYFSTLSAEGNASFNDVSVAWALGFGGQTLIVGSYGGAGVPAPVTLTPTVTFQKIECQDTDGCDVTMGETDVPEGTLVLIVNISANVVNFADTSGVSELAGPFAAGQWDSLLLAYEGTTWFEVSRSNN